MKVVLLNINPSISRLIALSFNKLQINYIEINNIDSLDYCDVLILDSDFKNNIKLCKEKSKEIILLLEKNEVSELTFCINKPFLPTDFINLFNGLTKNLKIDDNVDELEQMQEELKNMINESIEVNKNFNTIYDYDDKDIDVKDENLNKYNMPETFEELSRDYYDLLNDDEKFEEGIDVTEMSTNENINNMSDISNLKEKDILNALDNDIKNTSKTITETITEAVMNGTKEYKNYIKDINISINIKFKD
ncbi:hypothetical protein [Campylobacter sp. MG1]|uniref:hypothetical protein n=1 Tax=Campylobacter sp. MG1 TaxID=2976332 RepID=UPI00226CE105|nr:hypothetical protein [Campylobacter sp. MG1]